MFWCKNKTFLNYHPNFKATIITLSIGTGRPEHSVDPDQMPQKGVFNKGLHGLHTYSNILDRS